MPKQAERSTSRYFRPLTGAGLVLAAGLASNLLMWRYADHQPRAFLAAAGVIVSLLLALLYYTLTGARERAWRLVEARTRELRRSEERFRTATEVSTEWYWEQDADYRFVSFIGSAIAPAAREFFLGKTRWEAAPDMMSAEQWAAHRADLEARRPFVLKYSAPVADGSLRWVETKGQPRFDEHGQFVGYHGTARDITAQLAAEARLREQAELLQAILGHIDQGISVFDGELKLLCANRRFFDLLGFPDELDRPGISFESFVRFNAERGEYGPGDIETLVRERVELARQFLPHRFKRTRPDGSVLEIVGTPLPCGGMVTTYTDVTEQEQARAAIERSEARYRKLLEMLPDAVITHRDGRILYANPAARRLWGLDADTDPVGHEVLDFVHPDFHQAVRARIAAAAAGAALDPMEQRHRRSDGSEVQVETSAIGVLFEDGPAVLTVGRDISERKAAENAIRELNATLEQRVRSRTAELEASNRELEAFSYSVAHDLRAPLRALHGFSHLLDEEYRHRLDDNGRGYLSRIQAASLRMGQLIDDLLELARIGRQELKCIPTNLSRIAEQIRESLGEQSPERRVAWRIAPGLQARTDPLLIKVLLDNLLRNAWKFTAEREQAVIAFEAAVREGEAVFCVRDNGAGFDPAYAGKLFQPFQRLHDARRFEGTGIGLAIVRRIVERHGGRVWAEGWPGQGAAFFFTLP